MKSSTSPETTGTNKLKLKFRDSAQFLFSHMNMFGEDFKRVQTGIAFGFVTENLQSIEVEPSTVTIRPTQEHVYLYFKYPVSSGKATLINSPIELFDSEDYNLILLKSATYNQLIF